LKKAAQTRAGLDAEEIENVGGKKSERQPQRDGGRGRGDRNDQPRSDKQRSDKERSDKQRNDKPRTDNSGESKPESAASEAPRKPRPPRERRRVVKRES
jgi:hypothetical protein